MPSETMDFKSLSSPLYSSEDFWSSNERQAGFWKSDNVPNSYDSDQGTRSSLNVRPRPVSNFSESSNVNMIATQHESSLFSSSLSELFSRKFDTVASHCEEEGLLESLEELEAQTIGNLLPNDDDLLSGLTDGVDHIIQDNASEEMEELDLFSSIGGMDLGNDSSFEQRDSQLLDEACNSQLGVCHGSFAGEHPSRTLFVRNIDSDVKDSELKALFEQFGDIHTLDTACKHRGFVAISYYDIRATQNAIRVLQNRLFSCRKFDIHYSIPKENPSEEDFNEGTLVVFYYDSSVSNDELHHIFNVYGEIKEIRDNPQNRHHKLIDFFDVRAAKAALHAINGNESNDIAGKRIKVERSQPGASKCMVQQIPPELEQKECGLYLHPNSPPLKSPTSFPGRDLHGVIKSGSMRGRILSVEPAMHASSLETAFSHGISSSVPNTLPSLVRVKSVGNQCGITKSSSLGQLNFDVQSASAFHPHSLPEFHDGLANVVHRCPPDVAANINLKTQERIDNMQFCRVNSNGNSMEFNECVFESSGNGSCRLPGHHYKCSNSYKASGMMWPNSPPYFDGICAAPTLPKLHGLPRSPLNMMSTVLPINNQHVPSASGFNSPLWGTQHTYAGESPEASSFHHGSLGNMRFSSNTPHRVGFVSHNIFPHFGGNCVDFPFHPKNFGLQFRNQRGLMFPRRNHLIPMINQFDTHKERARSRRNEGGSSLADKKQYELDIDCIKRGEDDRTTLMIKNIPNKYTSKMLLAAIDERHKGTYDFIYLPIDFKNKCNMGYAFINMTNPNAIIPFYQVFNGKKWEKFNSEKVASLAYARIQGKAALIAHFQNSSLMNEDKQCRPILFKTDGPNAGDQVPFPMGVNIHNKPGRMRNNTQEDSLEGSPPNLGNGELSSGGDTFFSKESN